MSAFFYPNLGFCTHVEISGGGAVNIRVNASHDAGAQSDETRSFIDSDLWNNLKNGNPQIGEVIVAAPPCVKINGLRTEAQGGSDVIGMLDRPLTVWLLRLLNKFRSINFDNLTKTVKARFVSVSGILVTQNLMQ